MTKKTWSDLKRSVKEFDYHTLKNMGIGKSLLLWFLAISLIPLATLSFINFLSYYQGLNIMAKKSLFTTSQLRVNYLNIYFQEMSDYLNHITTDNNTIQVCESLPNSNSESPKWEEMAEKLRLNFGKTFVPESIKNIFFINLKGTVLFELNGNSELFKNLFSGSLERTGWGKTTSKILSTGKPMITDLVEYPLGSKELCLFLGKPVYNSKGEIMGVISLKISPEKIDRIVEYGIGFGTTGHVYLIGLDLKLRSASKLGDRPKILFQSQENDKTKIWQEVKANNVVLDPEGKTIAEEVSFYKNSQNIMVMGLYRNIDILEDLGLNWALVEEVNQDEAHLVAREMSSFAKISLLITTIMVLIISTFVTRRFVFPIKKISEWAKQVAHGELILRDVHVANNEVGEMRDSFNWLVNSLRSFSDVSQSVALGDYSKSVTVRSQKDVMAISMNQMVESFKTVVKQAKAIASGDYSTNVIPRSDKDTLGIALYDMTMKLREASIEITGQDWLKTGINELGFKIRGEKSKAELSNGIICFLARYLDAQLGFLYLIDDNNLLQLTATFAVRGDQNITKTLSVGEGLIGQVAKEEKTITFFANEFQTPLVDIGPEKVPPQHFIISPILFEGTMIGVIELGSFAPFDLQKQTFIEVSLDNISVAINTAKSREHVQELLVKTQEQAKELVMQKEELRQINQELEEQTKALRLSEENLQHQQEELRVINEELEERSNVLELQRDDIRKKNEALELAQKEIKQKAEALEIASRYKSEFLANMSHELRTPLNSILVLSELLSTNKSGALTPDEVEFATVINSSGRDLLDLINDVLDISKVEAGKMEIDIEEMNLEELQDYTLRTFTPIAKNKGIFLKTKLENGLPDYIMSDTQRVQQIIKNLMSNAIKFTNKGGVTLRIFRPDEKTKFTQPGLDYKNCIGIQVIDTGIGISDENAKMIFEAFQQADGTISRKFGGTGLGLTISRSFSHKLGGEIQLESKENKGSTFTLYLPLQLNEFSYSEPFPEKETVSPSPDREITNQTTDGEDIISSLTSQPDSIFENKKILICDDDMRNVFVLSKILEEKKVNILVGKNGREGIEKLQANPDTNLVLMDIMMPEIDGYTAMREIRKDPRFQQLPIIALTAKAMKGDREKCIEAGASDYLSKPVQTEKLLNLLRIWLQK
ncbi:MAG: ATP-binding protein [Bacteroidales bacterium]|nr:ATP-binding protein [Bacteroidales bacterium]MDD4602720.1 ATP-binding protein [Bacteroidales bacterium]